MVNIKGDKWLFVDVDDTLIAYEWPSELEKDTILIDNNGWQQRVLPRKEHIKILKTFKFLGYNVCVWSLTGAYWPEKIVKELKIEEYVDITMSKPLFLMDDQPVENQSWKRIYKELK